jgi:hypothetical protein
MREKIGKIFNPMCPSHGEAKADANPKNNPDHLFKKCLLRFLLCGKD